MLDRQTWLRMKRVNARVRFQVGQASVMWEGCAYYACNRRKMVTSASRRNRTK